MAGDVTGPGVLRFRTSYGARGGHASVSRKTKAGPIGPPFKYGVQLIFQPIALFNGIGKIRQLFAHKRNLSQLSSVKEHVSSKVS